MKNSQVYGFAISGGRQILYKLKNLDCCYLISLNNIEHYSKMLIHDQPNRIVGLGSRSGIVYKVINSKIKELIKNKELHSKNIFIDTRLGIDIQVLDFMLSWLII